MCDNVCITLGFFEGITHMNKGPDYNQLYEIAEGQAGYFTAAQARKVGFSWERLSDNTRTGKFYRISRGIYRLVHFPGSAYEDLFIAHLETGTNSVISHESALLVYNLSDALPGEIHLIVPRTTSHRHKGIRLHTNQLKPDEITSREGLPLTTVARTIADTALNHLPEEQIRQAIREGLQRGLVTSKELSAQAQRHGGRAKQIIKEVLENEKEI
jgi:predicted transcriptional regulator of viral defense system